MDKKKYDTYKRSIFKKRIAITQKNHDWIKENKDTRTDAGFLDKIINYYKARKKQD